MSIEFASRGEGRLIHVVLGLLLLHLTLISIQVEDPSGMLLIRRWVLWAGAPVMNGAASIMHAAGNLWTGYFWLRGARTENERLREDVRQLSLLNSNLAEAQQENSRLQRLLGFDAVLPNRTLGARVIGRAPGFLSNTLYLNRGRAEGVRPNQPVLSDVGIVGRTLMVSGDTCQVQLITNADASVGVMIERTRTPGVLRGSENPWLELNYVSNTEDVAVDDIITTSGLDGIYPKGLPVGKVVDSQKGKTGFRSIRVQPNADMLRIEEVLILLNVPKPVADQPAGSSTGK